MCPLMSLLSWFPGSDLSARERTRQFPTDSDPPALETNTALLSPCPVFLAPVTEVPRVLLDNVFNPPRSGSLRPLCSLPSPGAWRLGTPQRERCCLRSTRGDRALVFGSGEVRPWVPRDFPAQSLLPIPSACHHGLTFLSGDFEDLRALSWVKMPEVGAVFLCKGGRQPVS